ncbi:MAG: hypothetical protein IKR23_00055 [Lachnospiraceae bacterium]|nr:hypothetical protein [Lachnospiraceae bacterium]
MRRGKQKWFKKLMFGSGGVTIFEVMIALALFAVIVTPIMRSFVTAMSVNKNSRETMIATDVANSIMEGISGKTYEEVVSWLGQADTVGGFDLLDPTQNKFSSINDDWYNLGNTATGCFGPDSDPEKYEGDYYIDGVTVPDTNIVTGDSMLYGQEMAKRAILHLYTDTVVAGNTPSREDASPDKRLYFGFSYNDRYADVPGAANKGIPKLTYMMYSDIRKDNMCFDAIVTFIPRANNINIDTASGKTAQDYFAYEVTVIVYSFEFDKVSGEMKNRFNSTYMFDDAPCAILKGGIMNKSIQATE